MADFGLTKLTEVGSSTNPTGRLVGTFGYMPPEYDNFGSLFQTYALLLMLESKNLNMGLTCKFLLKLNFNLCPYIAPLLI